MGITLLIFPRFFGMLPPILIAGALGVELALAAVCLGVVYGSLRFLDQRERRSGRTIDPKPNIDCKGSPGAEWLPDSFFPEMAA